MSLASTKLEDCRADAFAKLERLADVSVEDLQFAETEALLRQIKDLTVELTGKKAKIAELKKDIGKVDAGERTEFAQAVQNLEKKIRHALERGESRISEK